MVVVGFWQEAYPSLLTRAFASHAEIGKDKLIMFEAKRVDRELLLRYRSQSGDLITSLSAGHPLLLVFLRHFG